jgi:hypothetical protein
VLDPDNVEALVGSAIVGMQGAVSSFYDDLTARLDAAEMAVIRALTLTPNHPMAYNILPRLRLYEPSGSRHCSM